MMGCGPSSLEHFVFKGAYRGSFVKSKHDTHVATNTPLCKLLSQSGCNECYIWQSQAGCSCASLPCPTEYEELSQK